MTGPWLNSAAIAIGGLSGNALGHHIPERLRTAMPMYAGLCSLGLGVVPVSKVQNVGAMVLAFLFGALLGELLQIERALEKRVASKDAGGIVVPALLLFCVSGTGIFGALREGMTGDPSILIAKAFLDLVTAAIFATRAGIVIAAIAVPQMIIQLSLGAFAGLLLPLTTPSMIADFSAVGGLVMIATGFRICGIAKIPVANLLPAMALAMPVSALWTRLV
ncbi:membrane protein [Bryobacterales bacterium F-183]|nr:membrane protein [Bryobacterales bacterium F-183]